MPVRKAPRQTASPDSLRRQRAGTYVTADGRFTVEGSSSGWLLLDGEQADELGLPLARGPFPTLEGAKAAIGPARSEPAPTSNLTGSPPRGTNPARLGNGPRAHARPSSSHDRASRATAGTPGAKSRAARSSPVKPREAAGPPDRPPVIVRAIRTADGDALRSLWADCGFTSLGDDDRSLARLARRNPGLVLVAAAGTRVVGSALGAWDGRRGWIYHVATAPTHRRQGIASRLVSEIEAGLRALGCPKVNVMVRHGDDDGAAFWVARGYGPSVARQFGKALDVV